MNQVLGDDIYMINYSKVSAENCEYLECLEETYNLFALFDTPANIIFIDQFINNINKFKDIFAQYFSRENIFFSCKSNKSFALLKYASEQNCGVEVSSNYELNDALKFTKKIIAAGPAKNDDYLNNSIDNHVMISVDDIEELRKIKEINKPCKVLLRISDLLGKISRFGINLNQIDLCLDIISNSLIQLEGFSFHINNYSLNDRVEAINEVIELTESKNIDINFIDIGGGIPTNYCSKDDYYNFLKKNNKEMYFKEHFITDYYPYYSRTADENALDYILKKVYKKLNKNKIEIIIEPGRSLLKNVGVSIYEVQYMKHLYNGENILVTNGNINCLSEQWFNSDYLIEPKLISKNNNQSNTIFASIAGNLCLEQDMITWRKIKFDNIPERGDLLVYYNTAGYQMDSNESEFHKIPLVKKYVVKIIDDRYVVEEDKKYDCK